MVRRLRWATILKSSECFGLLTLRACDEYLNAYVGLRGRYSHSRKSVRMEQEELGFGSNKQPVIVGRRAEALKH